MELQSGQFRERVLESNRPVLVDFWATWCPPCRMMKPVLEKLAVKVTDWADIYSVNIDRQPDVAAEFQISGVPTFCAWAGGSIVTQRTGALTESQLLQLLQTAREALPATAADDAADVNERDWVTVVSGLPRSGTSLMMRMLEAGGIPALTDRQRQADADNPNGYYELEAVKQTDTDSSWVETAAGSSVKMVFRLLRHLPEDRRYRVILMRRDIDEILRSQRAMLDRNGVSTDIADDRMRAMIQAELQSFYAWLPQQSHLDSVNVSYNELMEDPGRIVRQIDRHLGGTLDCDAMAGVIEPQLYRQRAA